MAYSSRRVGLLKLLAPSHDWQRLSQINVTVWLHRTNSHWDRCDMHYVEPIETGSRGE